MTDTLTGNINIKTDLALGIGRGLRSGKEVVTLKYAQSYSDGNAVNQAKGFFSETLSVPTGGITISLAADTPFTDADSTPTVSPEGLKLRGIIIRNNDDTNKVTVAKGTNGITGWLGTNAVVPAGGFIAATFPAGLDEMNDGVDDELTLTANTAAVNVSFTYLFG